MNLFNYLMIYLFKIGSKRQGTSSLNGGTLFIAIDGRGDLLRGQAARMGSLHILVVKDRRLEFPSRHDRVCQQPISYR